MSEERKCNETSCDGNCASCSKSGEHAAPPKSALNEFSKVKRVIGVVSGKGGVGKSLVTAMLAVEMSRKGYKTAILDADRNGLMKVGDALKSNRDDYLLILASSKTPKAPLVCFASGKGEKLGAGNAMKLIAPLLYGNGGGSSKLASGSINDLSKFDIAVAEVKEKLGE